MDKFWWVLNVVCLDFVTFFINYWTDIIVNTIGGAIGGFIVYRYVMRKENAREARTQQQEQNKNHQEKKENCTSALLSTQMTILLQMVASKKLKVFVDKTLAFTWAGTTLEGLFKNYHSQAAIAIFLRAHVSSTPHLFADLMPLTNYIEVSPIANNIIKLPYEIFEILNIPLKKESSETGFAQYFQELALCNERYDGLIATITQANRKRDSIMNSLIFNGKIRIDSTMSTLDEKTLDDYLGIIAGIFISARS